MANPYIQVALTYIHRLCRRGNLVFLLAACPMLLLAANSRDPFAILPLLMCIPFFLLQFAGHVIAPFVDWRAHLTPNFRRVHATVAAAATLVVILVLPAMVAWLAGCSLVATVAIVTVLFGATFWMLALGLARPSGGVLMTMVATGCPLLAVACVLVPPLRREFTQFMSGQLELQAIALSGMGLLMIVLGAMQLSRLDGDAIGVQYFLRGWNTWSRQNRGAAPWAGLPQPDEQAVKNHFVLRRLDSQMERLAEHARRASVSSWSAVCRWRVGMPNGWKTWLFGVGVVLAVQLAAWVAARGRLEASVFFWLTFLVWLIVFPSILSLSQFVQRGYLLGYEIMLPVERGTYLRQVGMAIALSQLRMWGGMYTGFMLWWLTAAKEPIQLPLMANVLAGSGLAQIGLFGVELCATWLAKRYSAQALITAFGSIVGVFAFAIAISAAMSHLSPLPALRDSLLPLAAAGLFAALGLLLTWLAYRRWLVVDFD